MDTLQLRFTSADHAHFIGQTFVYEVKAAKNPLRNGSYQLHILPGDPTSQVCTEFRAELHQILNSGYQAPMIVYPPAKGERREHRRGANLRNDHEIIEVASMSSMMKMSMLGSPMTPAVVFKLAEKLPPPPPPPPTPALTGHYAIFQSRYEGDDCFASLHKLPDDWHIFSHREMMDWIIQRQVLDGDDSEYWEDHRDETLLIVDAKMADIIETVLASASCNDSANTAAHWTAVQIAKKYQVDILRP